MSYPMQHITVVDLTQYVTGPYCTQVLADLGANVIKVEPTGSGDVYRRQGPVFAAGESASFLALNRGKASVTLDLASRSDRQRLEEIIAGADVLVENARPGALRKHGLDYSSLSARHRRLIYCSMSAFGERGPLAAEAGYDLTVQATAGLLALTGHPGSGPARIPIPALDFGCALYGTVGILAALAERERTGRGQRIATSMLETSLAWLSIHVLNLLLGGEEPAPSGSRSPFFAPYETYATSDGHVAVVGTGERDAWGNLCRALRLEHLVDDPRFATNQDRVRRADLLKREIEAVLSREPTAKAVERLRDAKVTCAPVQSLREALESPQVEALGLLQQLRHPRAGTIPTVRLPLTFSAAQSTATAPPPMLGADDRVASTEAGGRAECDERPAEPRSGRGSGETLR